MSDTPPISADIVALARELRLGAAYLNEHTTALARMTERWPRIQRAVLDEDRVTLGDMLSEGAAQQAHLDYALMHLRTCPGCPEDDEHVQEAAAVLRAQAFDWQVMLHTSPYVDERVAQRLFDDCDPRVIAALEASLS